MGTHLSAILHFADPLDARVNLLEVASALENCGWVDTASWEAVHYGLKRERGAAVFTDLAPPSGRTTLEGASEQLPGTDELLRRRFPVLEGSSPAAQLEFLVGRARHRGHSAFGSITIDMHKVGRRFFADPLCGDERVDALQKRIRTLPWRDWKALRAKRELADLERENSEARADLLWLFVAALAELPRLESLGFHFDDLDPVPEAAALLWFRDAAALAKRVREAHGECPEMRPGLGSVRLLPPLSREEEAALTSIERHPQLLDELRHVRDPGRGLLVSGPGLFPLQRRACAPFFRGLFSSTN